MTPFDKARKAFDEYAAMDAPNLPANEISALQVRLARWENTKFANSKFDNAAFGMVEELGEAAEILINQLMMSVGVGKVAKAHLKHSQGIRNMTREAMREKVADGLADQFIFGLQEATRQRLDLYTLLVETIKEVMGRDWIANPVTGSVSER